MPAEQRAAMGEQAVQTFRARYDMEGTARAVIKLFEGAVAEGEKAQKSPK
jgi:hypothetical protein